MRLVDWTCAETAPGLLNDPAKLDSLDLDWFPLIAPGTVAGALGAAGRWSIDDDRDFDASDWWLRCRVPRPDDVGSRWELRFDGLATLCDVWLNGSPILSVANMFRSHSVDVTDLLGDDNEVVIRCASLGTALAAKRPRPRWKTNLVDRQNLRWYRTSLHGRRPTWTGACAPVGPWRPVTLGPLSPVAVRDVTLGTAHDGVDGRLDVTVRLAGAVGIDSVFVAVGDTRTALTALDDGPHDDGPDNVGATFAGTLTMTGAEPWWPATHGDQPRYDAFLEVGTGGRVERLPLGGVGFRTVEFGPADAPQLRVNGVPVFVRGVVWVPADPVGLAPDVDALRATLGQIRDAGMNMVRVPGTSVYESDDFLVLCDELGLLVWHDLMFARMDYPTDDPEFAAEIRAEVVEVTSRLAGHPSVVVVGGGAEVGQQAAMVGRPVPTAELVGSFVAAVVSAGLPGVPYVADVPIGGTHPFTVDRGIATYFGVGGYRRPVSDARVCGVRFAAECLAFANVPTDDSVEQLLAGGGAVGDPRWKRGVARDPGASWDFEDVRDHYVRELYGIEPGEVRAVDSDRYLDLGRATTAKVMAEVFSQWRRADSSCNGALVLESRDCRPGPGPGLIDSAGRPKSTLSGLRGVLSPVALMVSDEGLNGLDVFAVNDLAHAVGGALHVAVFVGDACVTRTEHPLVLDGRSQRRMRLEDLVGAFLDVTYAYRFGATAPSCVALHWREGDKLLARALFRPGRPPVSRAEIGLAASAVRIGDARFRIEVTARSYAHFVQIEARGAQLSDNGFDVEPGGSVTVEATGADNLRARVRALNGADSTPIRMEYARDEPGAS